MKAIYDEEMSESDWCALLTLVDKCSSITFPIKNKHSNKQISEQYIWHPLCMKTHCQKNPFRIPNIPALKKEGALGPRISGEIIYLWSMKARLLEEYRVICEHIWFICQSPSKSPHYVCWRCIDQSIMMAEWPAQQASPNLHPGPTCAPYLSTYGCFPRSL